MEDIKLTSKGDSNLIKVNGTLTSGKIFAIISALEKSSSPVANDVKCFFRDAIYNDCQKNPKSQLNDVLKYADYKE